MLKYIVPILFGLVGAAILVALGSWQMQRLGEKSARIGQIEARMALGTVPLPLVPLESDDAYRPVKLLGTIVPDEIHVLTSTREDGPGFRIISVFETAGQRRIMIDRGYVPATLKDTERPREGVSLEGNMVWPKETDIFTPEPDLFGNIWFARDVDAMAAALKTEPLLIQLGVPAGTNPPRPMPVTVSLPNNHLSYAVTWFLLAVAWVAMAVYWGMRIRRGTA